MNKYVLDTNVLLNEDNLNRYEQIILPYIILEELDKLKYSSNNEKAYKARQAINKIKNAHNIEFKINYNFSFPPWLDNSVTDNRILGFVKNICETNQDVVLVTSDLNMIEKAKALGIPYQEWQEERDVYTGWRVIEMNNDELAEWYESENKSNKWGLYVNEYLIIKNQNEVVDIWCWTINGFRHVPSKKLDSKAFGKIKPLDEYQVCAIDSMLHNQMVMIKGKPGSGKSLLCLSYAMSMLEKDKYDKLIIFVNNLPAKNAVKIGFLPGTKDEKLLDSQIGHMLTCKFGNKIAVEQLINQEKLLLLPFSDIRGFDTSGKKAIVYITEAQNLDIPLIKLAIQRIGEDCQLLIDGDYNAQVDSEAFEDERNGMRRVSKVYRGQDFYGEIELPTIHRSRMASFAENL